MANNHPHQQSQSGDQPPTYQPPVVPPTPSIDNQLPHQPQVQPHQRPGAGSQMQASAINPNDDTPQPIWVARPAMPEAPDVPEEARIRHEESVRRHPELNLSKGEFVISAIRRHPIGLFSIWFVSGLIIVLSFAILTFLAANSEAFLAPFGIEAGAISTMAILGVPFLILCGLAVLGGLISTYVYLQNKFFLTNESVMQFIQVSLFSRKEQTVSLSNIEDASYRQHGILQHIFNYGNIRLSTQGDETTYRFSYVSNPKKQIAMLNSAVESFKMGRPVMHLDDQ